MRSDHIGHILSAIGDKEFGRKGRKNCATLSGEVCSAVSRGANNMLSNVSFYPPSPLACSLSAFQPLHHYYGSFPALSPTPVFLITPSLSLNELPSDYWGFWRSIRNMCEGLEAADGKPSVEQLTLSALSSNEPPRASGEEKLSASSKASTYWLFCRILFSAEYINRKKLLTLKAVCRK